ncbi:MAG: hypothetical protein ABI831_08795 [Betaproteobacteria bacterium]
MTVCDALDTEAPPIIVREKSGSQAAILGTQIGFRLMEVDDHHELSGAAYPFSHFAAPGVVQAMRRAARQSGKRGSSVQDRLSGSHPPQVAGAILCAHADADLSGRPFGGARAPDHGPLSGAKSMVSEPDLPPEVLAEVIGKAIHRIYANWADEPIQALDGKTPRQATATPAGLERVKGLLRSYEAGEREQAAHQGRPVVSYAILWNALGITP